MSDFITKIVISDIREKIINAKLVNKTLQNSFLYGHPSPPYHKFIYESQYRSSPNSIFFYSSTLIIGVIILISTGIFIKQLILTCHTYCCITNISNNENEAFVEDSDNYDSSETSETSEINDSSVIPIIINKIDNENEIDNDNEKDLPTYGEIYNNHV